MGEPAVIAPDGKMPATNCYFMGTGHVTVSAFRGFKKVPDIVTLNWSECSWLSDIFNTRDKDTGHATIFTRYLRLVRYCFYDLVCHLLAMVAVSIDFCKNKPFAHRKYWMCPGSLICCTTNNQPQHSSIGSDGIAKQIAVYYTPVLFDTISDIIQEKIVFFIRIKSQNLSSVPVFRMSNDFLEYAGQNNNLQVSKFNYREKTIYIP